jgi:single-strand DNA-binding protein
MISITLVGNAGKDPEVRYNENGSSVANLTIGCRGYKGETEWFSLSIWGKQAQVAADYVRKGGLIAVTGTVITDKWTDKKTGEEKSRMKVNVSDLRLLGGKPGEGKTQGKAQSKSSKRQEEEDEDDIPF